MKKVSKIEALKRILNLSETKKTSKLKLQEEGIEEIEFEGEEIAEGVEVTAYDSEGEEVVVPDGEHVAILEDGSEITFITEDEIITEVIVSTEDVQGVELNKEEEKEEEKEEDKKMSSEMEERLTILENQVAEILAILSTMVDSNVMMHKEFKKMNGYVEKTFSNVNSIKNSKLITQSIEKKIDNKNANSANSTSRAAKILSAK
jgi:hypothetical protein